jgi:hypothetical protein
MENKQVSNQIFTNYFTHKISNRRLVRAADLETDIAQIIKGPKHICIFTHTDFTPTGRLVRAADLETDIAQITKS